jgi:type IV pilus assembly protein PilQ
MEGPKPLRHRPLGVTSAGRWQGRARCEKQGLQSSRPLGLRFSLLLAAISFGVTLGAICLFAQQPSQRTRPNYSVRSTREAAASLKDANPNIRLGSASRRDATTFRVAQAPAAQPPLPTQQPPNPAPNDSEPAAGQDEPDGSTEGPQQFRVPLQAPDFQNMRIKAEDGLLSIVARDAPLRDVVTLLAETQGLNIVTADPLTQPISVTLDRVKLNDALDAVLSIAGYTFAINRNIILISSLNNSASVLPPQAQGLRLEVFQLDYAMAMDVNTAVTGMLSPLGQSYVIASNSTENRRSRELVAVNDLPQFVDRIRQYIAQVDLPPRQVLIEAHILQVDLDDENRHGVNLRQLFNRSQSIPLLDFQTSGFATAAPGTQAFTFRFNDGNLTAFLEMLCTQTDAKTLASPRLMVLNGQQARLQVGQQLGFRVTTTTETSTTESVDFLDVGVVLEVTPRISRDGKIMMSVRPEVSSGQVNPTTGLPEEETTELETDILLCDHEGIVIGGLIQETDSEVQSKVSWLGDLYMVGRLFQRRELIKERKEIIITLIPRLVPYESPYVEVASEQYARTDARLLE